ncbi:MAG: ABC transporter substrate-binding protein, partial [bacterium]
GQWASAEEEFRLIQTDFPDDPIAQVAELYSARAALREFDAADAGAMRALPLLSGLAGSTDVDPRIRYAAQVYLAAAHAAMGDKAAALSALATYPGASLSPNVLKRDRVDAWTLVVEGLAAADRQAEAIAGLAEAYDASDEDAPLTRYARARAFDFSSAVSDDVASEWASDASPLLRAVGLYELVKRESTSDVSLLQSAADALRAVGASAQASELATRQVPPAYEGPLRIGLLAPLSGPNRAIGERAVRGASLASLGSSHGQVTLVIENSEQPGAFERLNKAGVLAIVGPVDAQRTREIAPKAADARIPVLALSTEIPASTDAWVFQDFVDAPLEARATAKVATSDLGAMRIAVLVPDIGYGKRMAAEFSKAAAAAGAQIVLESTYDRKATDYSKTAAAVAAAKPDAIYIPDTGSKVAEVTAFLAAKNIWGRVPNTTLPKDGRTRVYYLGTSLWQDPTLLRQAASYVEGAVIPAWFSPAFASRESQDFYTGWQAQGIQSAPGELEAFSYDAVSHLVAEISATSTISRQSIRDGLVNNQPTRGLVPTTWGRDGRADPQPRGLFRSRRGLWRQTDLLPEQVDRTLPSP